MVEDIPPKLYKYQPYDKKRLDNLENKRLWFSKPKEFNDPFDCAINFDFKNTTKENWGILYEQMKALLEDNKSEFTPDFVELFFSDLEPNDQFTANAQFHLGSIFKQQLQIEFLNRGIACFSAIKDNILMWSHYADGHKGFCIEFDTRYYPFTLARRVNYALSFPPLDLSEGRKEIMWDLVTAKVNFWSYEKEWRLFHERGNKLHTIDPRALSGIYFGCALPEDHKKSIVSVLADSPVRLYQAKTSGEKFKIEFTVYKN